MTNAMSKPRTPHFATFPTHECLRLCQRMWDDLQDSCVLAVVRDGLLFDWIPGMDSVNPDLLSWLDVYCGGPPG